MTEAGELAYFLLLIGGQSDRLGLRVREGYASMRGSLPVMSPLALAHCHCQVTATTAKSLPVALPRLALLPEWPALLAVTRRRQWPGAEVVATHFRRGAESLV